MSMDGVQPKLLLQDGHGMTRSGKSDDADMKSGNYGGNVVKDVKAKHHLPGREIGIGIEIGKGKGNEGGPGETGSKVAETERMMADPAKIEGAFVVNGNGNGRPLKKDDRESLLKLFVKNSENYEIQMSDPVGMMSEDVKGDMNNKGTMI